MKKTASLFLAMMMVMALSVPVFATGSGAGSGDPNSWSATGAVKIPTIAVTLPGNGTVFVNPFGFKVVVSSGVAATDTEAAASDNTVVTSEKIVSPVYLIKNESPMALDVGVIASATINTGSTMTLSANPLSSTSTKKEAFIFAQFQVFAADKVSDATASGGVEKSKQLENLMTKANFAYAHEAIAASGTSGEPGYVAAQAAVTEEQAAAANKTNHVVGITIKVPKDPTSIITLPSGSVENPTYVGFRFFGDAVTNPKDAWKTSGTGADGVNISMVFSFNPV